ncbi:MAG: hypothetical protein LBV40_02360 [Methanomicrobiales archaeon]|jgi:hypothetical protein|nr:hypothetical protein [Methanomicrobiales archaeon]
MSSEDSYEEGYFLNGRWVKGKLSDAAGSDSARGGVDFGARIAAVRADVSRVLGDVLTLGKDILETEDGRQHIESQMKKVGDDISVTLSNLGNEAAKSFEDALEKIKR